MGAPSPKETTFAPPKGVCFPLKFSKTIERTIEAIALNFFPAESQQTVGHELCRVCLQFPRFLSTSEFPEYFLNFSESFSRKYFPRICLKKHYLDLLVDVETVAKISLSLKDNNYGVIVGYMNFVTVYLAVREFTV